MQPTRLTSSQSSALLNLTPDQFLQIIESGLLPPDGELAGQPYWLPSTLEAFRREEAGTRPCRRGPNGSRR